MRGKFYIFALSVLVGAMHAAPLFSQTELIMSDQVLRGWTSLRNPEGRKSGSPALRFSGFPVPAGVRPLLSLADLLMELGSYDEAITEYKRFIFFNPEGEYTGYALYRMGLAYRADRNWHEAIDAFKASVSAAKDSRTADERRIALATTLIASGNYSLARLELLKVSKFSKHSSLRLKSLYFSGVASLYMFDWDAAGDAFNTFYSGAGLEPVPTGRMKERAKEIDSILLETRGSYKSVRLARFLSAVLPGLGQIYAGDWRDGLNALALNGLAIGFFANAIYRRDYKDAVLIYPISIRYYMGNIYRTEVDVSKYNESLDRQNALKILKLVRADEPTLNGVTGQ